MRAVIIVLAFFTGGLRLVSRMEGSCGGAGSRTSGCDQSADDATCLGYGTHVVWSVGTIQANA